MEEQYQPPLKHSSFSSISSLEVSSTNSSKQGSDAAWKVLRDSVDLWILRTHTHSAFYRK